FNSSAHRLKKKENFMPIAPLQKTLGGKVELIHDDNFHQGGFETNTLNYI
ncbi:6327_t:CDS:1, partial [Gigaspora rosea]